MFTVMWNPLGFHIVDRFPTDAKMNGDYFTTNILAPLEQKIFPAGRRLHTKRLTLHLENSSIHMSESTEVDIGKQNIVQLKHTPSSPDLAPSDSDLFLTVKEKLKNIQMIGEEHVLYRLQELLNGISRKELDKVFGTWINRLMIVSQGDKASIS
jgi:hypothetical protein